MTNSTTISTKSANNSSIFDQNKETKIDNDGSIVAGCLAMILAYGVIMLLLFSLWSQVDPVSIFDGYMPPYP